MSSAEQAPVVSLYLPQHHGLVDEVTISCKEQPDGHLFGIVLPPYYLHLYEKALDIDPYSSSIQEFADYDPQHCYDKLGNFCISLTSKVLVVETSDNRDHPDIETVGKVAMQQHALELVKPLLVDRYESDVEIMIWSALRDQCQEIPLPIVNFSV